MKRTGWPKPTFLIISWKNRNFKIFSRYESFWIGQMGKRILRFGFERFGFIKKKNYLNLGSWDEFCEIVADLDSNNKLKS